MSVAVALEELGRQIDGFGREPLLITVNGDGGAHVVSITVAFDGQRFSLSPGGTTRANAGQNPAVTLLWPSTDGPYDLLVDGRASVEGDDIVVEPTRAVLHRRASAPDELRRCVPLEQAD